MYNSHFIHRNQIHSNFEFLKRMMTCLEKINERPIRGEYKVWIYCFYLVQSVRFHLVVEMILQTALHKIHSLATKYIKKWLLSS